MIAKKEFDGNCWICGSKANSKEHRHKKTDVKRGFYMSNKDINAALLMNDNGIQVIQGPDSKKLKFKDVICQKCNNSYTKPFDLAYETFIKYILNNVDALINDKRIDFNAIFPSNTREQMGNLFRYYIKNFGCRLAENDIEINSFLIDFMNFKIDGIKTLLMRFEVDYPLYLLLDKFKKENFMHSNLYKGVMQYELDSEDGIGLLYTYYTNEWFRIHFVYSDFIANDKLNWLNRYYNDFKMPIEVSGLDLNPKDIYSRSLDEIIEMLVDCKGGVSFKNSIDFVSEKINDPYTN